MADIEEEYRVTFVRDAVNKLREESKSEPHYVDRIMHVATDLIGSALAQTPAKYRKQIAKYIQGRVHYICSEIVNGTYKENENIVVEDGNQGATNVDI